MRRLLCLAAAVLLPYPAVTAAGAPAISAAAGGPITPADIMRLRDMREVEISPDGRSILFTVQAQMATFDSPQSTIWLVDRDGKAPARRFITSAGVNAHPRWSPDGRQIAFLSNRRNPLAGGRDSGFEFKPQTGNTPETPADAASPPTPDQPGEPSRQLWLMPRDGGEAVPLTALPGDIADFGWSPAGDRLFFLSADPGTSAEKADRAARRDAVVDESQHFTRLWVLDLASHVARRVSPTGMNVSGAAWSPDGRRLAVRLTDTTGINDYFYHSRIALLDPLTGATGPALIEHAAGAPLWSPDGRSLLAEVIRTPGFIGAGLRIHDLAAGRTRALADDHPGLLTHPHWTRDGRAVVALSFEQTRSRVVRIAVGNGSVATVAQMDGETSDIAVAPRGQIAVALSSPDRPADVWTLDAGRPRVLTRINPEVAGWHPGRVQQVAWKSTRDGTDIYGVLVTPPGYRKGTPIKTVVQGHGGPEWAWWSGWLGSWHEWAQMLATHGYAVLLPNPRGSDGQGTAFARAVGRDWGGIDYQDVLDGVDMLIDRRIADPARLGIGGWSYGGFLAAWAVTHDHRFKAAIVGAGPVDMAAMARITDTPDFTTGYFGEPQANLAALDQVSSVRRLDKVEAPVLVLHGAADTRVPPTLGLAFYRGLRLLGKTSEMVRYPREPHWFHESEHQKDIQVRVLEWFDRYL